MFAFSNFYEFLWSAVAVLFAISVHEFAHGLAAKHMGDPTPELSGRLTLNPFAHLDPIGTIMLLLFRFGWAKPVPINIYLMRDPYLGLIVTAFAGPTANVLAAILAVLIFKLLGMMAFMPIHVLRNLASFLRIFTTYNVYLAAFNLIPIPPLDGSRVLEGLAMKSPSLRGAIAPLIRFLENFGVLILVVLILTGAIRFLLYPILKVILAILGFFA